MFDQLAAPSFKAAANALAGASVTYSAAGTWFDFAQPIVAIFAGLAGGIWACLQIYIWIEKRVKR